jgi:G protein-coupled receptor 158
MSEADAAAPRGKYTCICREGFYIPNETIQGFQGEKIEASAGESASGNFSCIPCPGGCFCDQSGHCLFGDPEDEFPTETLMKAVIGAILGACMLCCLVLSIIVFRQRKCKTIASGMWTILETILFGIFLLYSAVAIHFVQVSNMVSVDIMIYSNPLALN